MNREQLKTFERMVWRRDNFRNYLRMKENRDYLNLEERFEGVSFIPNDEIDIEWIDESEVNLGSQVSCYSFLYLLEQGIKRVYLLELELII